MRGFILELWGNRRLIVRLAVRDINRKYLGSFLGILWAFVQPMVTILVIWFVFEFGFKPAQVDESVPFWLWLVSAMIPWFFFSEAALGAANSIVDQASIVKKVVFRVSLLPVVKLLSASAIHFVFLMILILLVIANGISPEWEWLSVIYYFVSAWCFLLALSLITASIAVFVRDVVQVISVITQIGFWATPIFWDLSMVPSQYHFWFKLNPAYYVTEGYRAALSRGEILAFDLNWTLYFWAVTISFFFIGIICFRRLRPHFAEVL